MMALTMRYLMERPVELPVDALHGGGDDRDFLDCPKLSAEAIQKVFADAVRLHRLTAPDATEADALKRKCVHVVLRDCSAAVPVRREWFGTVVTASAGRYGRGLFVTVDYTASPLGPLRGDDEAEVVSERGTLPPRAGELVDVLFVELVDSIPAVVTGDSDSDDDPADAPAARDARRDDQVDPYASVPDDVAAEVDLALWNRDPRSGVCAVNPDSHLTGKFFLELDLCSLEEARRKTPAIVWASVTEAVRKAHVADLKLFRDYLRQKPGLLRLPLDVLLACHLQRLRSERHWSWSTVGRVASGLVGAFASLPLYGVNAPSVGLKRLPHFKALMLAADRLSAAAGPREPVAAIPEDVRVALQHLTSDKAKVALILCWYTSARPCDILHLKDTSVVFPEGNQVRVQITRGKVVNSVGAYHIHTQIAADDHFALVRRYVESHKGFLFPLRSGYQRQALLTELRLALRKSRPTLELRSLRRGSLQLLAKGGASEEELLTFSRHTTVAALRRYLGFGAVPHAAQRSGIVKAAVLAGDLHGGAPREFLAPEVRINDWLAVSTDGDISISKERAPNTPATVVDRSGYALHAKPQTREPIDLAAVDALAEAAPKDVRDAWFAARRLLTDADGLHSRVPWDGLVREAALRPGDIAKLLDINNVAEVDFSDLWKVGGTIQVFLTAEDSKLRYRVIKHPFDYNRFYGRDTLLMTLNATKHSARGAILKCAGSIVIDLAAEFDQLLLEEAVSWCQVFSYEGKFYRNLRLPMGGRHSTSIGTALIRVLLAFDMPDVVVDWATDAARFAGPRDRVIDAAWTFVQRCRRVRAKANEIDCATATRQQVAELYQTSGADFMGEVADYGAKTVQCRARHVEKLRAYQARCFEPGATYADLFGLYGMLYYMSDTLGLRIDRRLRTRLYFSGLARALAAQPSLWTAPAPSRPPAADVGAWVAEALENRPAKLERAPRPDTVIIGDACRLGYAGIFVRFGADGKPTVSMIQRRWRASSGGTLDVGLSTVSEPEAAARLLDDAAALFPGCVPLYVTDHEPFVGAHSRGFSIAPGYNSRVARIRDRHPCASLVFQPGESMLADKYSRFLAVGLDEDDVEAAKQVAASLLASSVGETEKIRVVGRGRIGRGD
jgi:hypothetical protein